MVEGRRGIFSKIEIIYTYMLLNQKKNKTKMQKSTSELAQEIYDVLYPWVTSSRDEWMNQGNWNYRITLNAIQRTEVLTKFGYEEQRVDEILKTVIEKNREILIELIKQENALVKEEQQAMEALQKLKKYREEILEKAKNEHIIYRESVKQVLLQIKIIKELFKNKDAQIELALSVVASDLAQLVASLNSAKQIKA